VEQRACRSLRRPQTVAGPRITSPRLLPA
jgi:hypothetical protein